MMTALIALQGETWEQLCYRAYQQSTEVLVMSVRNANRDTARAMSAFQFSGGERITIPTITSTEIIITEVAPWER
ncbi:tail protein X [Aliivibrio salmonicida]|uniref:tail protein X n=1 Tax=Aliivibrio salmonicida TaxID=40269 RepID=UPI00406D1C33